MISPTDEAGKAVGGFMEVMKGQPLSLALVVVIFALLGMLWSISSRADAQLQTVLSHQDKVQELLARCVVPK